MKPTSIAPGGAVVADTGPPAAGAEPGVFAELLTQTTARTAVAEGSQKDRPETGDGADPQLAAGAEPQTGQQPLLPAPGEQIDTVVTEVAATGAVAGIVVQPGVLMVAAEPQSPAGEVPMDGQAPGRAQAVAIAHGLAGPAAQSPEAQPSQPSQPSQPAEAAGLPAAQPVAPDGGGPAPHLFPGVASPAVDVAGDAPEAPTPVEAHAGEPAARTGTLPVPAGTVPADAPEAHATPVPGAVSPDAAPDADPAPQAQPGDGRSAPAAQGTGVPPEHAQAGDQGSSRNQGHQPGPDPRHAKAAAPSHVPATGALHAAPGTPPSEAAAPRADAPVTAAPSSPVTAPAPPAGSVPVAQPQAQVQPAGHQPVNAPVVPAPPVSHEHALPQATLSPAGTAAAVERIQDLVRIATLRDGHARATLQLKPAELGTVNVHLRTTADGLVATIGAQDAAALTALRHAGAELQQALQDRGVTLARIDLQLSSGNESAARDRRESQAAFADGRGSGGGRDHRRAPAGDEVELVIDHSPTTTTVLPDGVLVDVRV
jgi:flagellar hook-length control protein FliK